MRTETEQKNYLCACARQRAKDRLAREHPDEYDELLTAERVKLGLPPSRVKRNGGGVRA